MGVKVNVDTDRLSPEERERKKLFTSMEPTVHIPPDGIFPVYCTPRIRFKIKKPAWDAKGAIDGFFAEEDMRRQFFYPHLPCNFMDVGVAHGSWTLPALASGARVLGFEIDPRYHETLRESLLVNKELTGEVSIHSIGLYSEHGMGDVQELEGVEFAPLDMVMRYVPFAPQYIKIDVEGLEIKVLEGARKVIDLFHPKLFIETHYWANASQDEKEYIDNGIYDFLKEYGYSREKGRVEESFTYFFFT